MILPYNSSVTELNQNCIFCKIIKGEIPSDKIYEDKNFLVFLDIKPVSFGHLLVIPKKHIVWMQDADDKMISDIFKLTKKMMISLKEGLKCDYVQESVVGNEVPHFHIHIFPRYFNEHFPNLPTKVYSKLEVKNVLKKIIKTIK
jgi:histidine triad (HIT) family protein